MANNTNNNEAPPFVMGAQPGYYYFDHGTHWKPWDKLSVSDMAFISISLIVVGLVVAACCIMPVLAWALEKEDIRRKKKKEAEEMEETNIRDRNDEDDNEIATLYDPYEKTEHTADKTRIWFCSSNERFPNDKKDKYGYKYMQIT